MAIKAAMLLPALTCWSAMALAIEEDPNANLTPTGAVDGPVLEVDFPGLQIGVAEYEEGPTGATLFLFDSKVKGAVDVRGGSPGTVLTDLLRQGSETPYLDAIVLSGGSAFGLAAATGAQHEIRLRYDDPGDWRNIAAVAGAILFDLGSRRFNAVVPDERLGRALVRNAKPGVFPLGAHGAGRLAMQGGYFGWRVNSGQGGAVGRYGPTRIAVFTAVNAFGTIVDRSGNVVRCGPKAMSDCGGIAEMLADRRVAEQMDAEAVPGGLTSNTTISLVVTNQRLDYEELRRLAMQVHMSMGRAIQPFSTIFDGDTLFSVTTDEVENPALSIADLGVLASELMWDAVLSSVPPLPTPARLLEQQPEPERLARYQGDYQFAPDMTATVALRDGVLVLIGPDRESIYFPEDRRVVLKAATNGVFVLDTDRADTLRFSLDEAGTVTALTINPGTWPVLATRIR